MNADELCATGDEDADELWKLLGVGALDMYEVDEGDEDEDDREGCASNIS